MLRTTAFLLALMAAAAPAQILQATAFNGGCTGVLSLSGGMPGAPFLIAADLGPGPVVVPGLGVVELDLGPGFFVLADGFGQGLALDASGSIEFAFAIPPLAAPLPAIYLQAVVAIPFGLTLTPGLALTVQPSQPFGFADATASIPAETRLAEDAVLADLDGDGDLDAVLAESGTASGTAAGSRLLINQGGLQGGTAGTFADETLARAGGPLIAALSAAVGDVDGDGDLDLFLGADDIGVNAPNVLLLNQGGLQGGLPGFFAADASFPGGAFETQAATFADTNGDGDLDLVLGNGVDVATAPQPCEHLVNIGGTFFIDNAHFGPAAYNVPGETDAVLAGDVNGDLTVDLYLVRDGQDILLLNTGLGTFTDATANLPVLAANSTAGVLADFDQDGDLDVFTTSTAAPGSSGNRLFLNDGSGGFQNLVTLPSAMQGGVNLDADAADLDGDGDLDLVVAVHALGTGERSYAYLNQGGAQGGGLGTFLPQVLGAAVSEVITAIAAGDVDGDGDQDLWLGSQGFFGATAQDQLLTGTRCQ